MTATGFVATSIAPEDLPGVRSALGPVGDRLDGSDVVKVIVIGSPRSVENTIRVLYLRGFAELYEWSLLDLLGDR